MIPALPYHYALSELFVAATGLIGAFQLQQKNRPAAWGLLPFGLAGLVGAVQIAGDLGGLIIELHRLLSRPGAVFGLTCMVCAIGRQDWKMTAASSLLLSVASMVFPGLFVPVSALLLLVATALVLGRGPCRAYADAAGFFLLLPAQLIATALRPAHPDIAWHLFHGLVGVWLLIVTRIFLQNRFKGPEWLTHSATRLS